MNPEKWKYTQEERPCGKFGKCYDCELPYNSPKWADVIVVDEIWEQINPSIHKGGGLLCFNCICGRLEELGIKAQIKITSGPFLFDVERT
jgi:hypothetical protein